MQAKQELMELKERLRKQIAILESEMETVDGAIRILEREHQSTGPQDNKEFRKMGLSDACRQIVGSEWISPTEVRERMMQGGYKNDDRAKLLGSVFATLKRLAKRELEGKKVDGKMKYRKRQAVVASAEVAA